jgi:hypothetical protein
VDWLVVEDKQGKTGRNNMGIFKKIMKKQPSAKAKGTIRKMLANPVIDPDPKEFAKNFKKPLTPKKAPAKSPSQPNREAMIKNAISNLKTKTPRAIANKTPTAMKPPVISPLSQGPYGRSLKRSSPKPATRTAGSTESVSNQPSVQGAVKRLAKGPGMKKGGVVKKAGGGMLGPSKQGRPMNIAAPQGPSVQQPLSMAVPYGKIANKARLKRRIC